MIVVELRNSRGRQITQNVISYRILVYHATCLICTKSQNLKKINKFKKRKCLTISKQGIVALLQIFPP